MSRKSSSFPVLFDDFLDAAPYDIIDHFAGALRPEVQAHRVPALDTVAPDLAFGMFGVAGATSWVHESKYGEQFSAPMIFNWKVLLGLTAHGYPFLCELIERRHLALAALVWRVASHAFRQYNVCTYEMFSRCLQAAYVGYLQQQQPRDDLTSFPLLEEEKPVFMHYYNEQLDDVAFLQSVKNVFDQAYEPLRGSPRKVIEYADKFSIPQHISVLYMDLIRGGRDTLPPAFVYPMLPTPPFGPAKPGIFLYELLYANHFRYRPGGVAVVEVPPKEQPPGKPLLPPALAINFNYFIPYRAANMALYNKLRTKGAVSIYNLAIEAVDTFNRHYYGVLHNKGCGAYYESLARGSRPASPETLATTFIIPLPILKDLTDAAVKYSVNYLVGLSARPKINKERGAVRYHRAVSAKSILSVMSPPTPYLEPSEFRFTHRYHHVLVSPPWPLTLAGVHDYYAEGTPGRIAQHLGRTYVTPDVLRRLPESKKYMTPELFVWLSVYDKMNKFVFKSELRLANAQSLNRVVREERGAKGLRFRPEEDDAIIRLYRPGMSVRDRAELNHVCFGRSMKSLSVRGSLLRRQLLDSGVTEISQLPHGARTEVLLKEIRDAKKTLKKKEGRT